MTTGIELTINGKKYNDDTCNDYQKVLMMMVRKESEHHAKMAKRVGIKEEELTKQMGVIEYFAKQLPVYDGESIELENHMFGSELPEARVIKHAQRKKS